MAPLSFLHVCRSEQTRPVLVDTMTEHPTSAAELTRCKEPVMPTQVALQSTDSVLRRIQAEFGEMPGLKLTAAQARRLWGADQESCDTWLACLVTSGFLARTRDGAFVRRDRSYVR